MYNIYCALCCVSAVISGGKRTENRTKVKSLEFIRIVRQSSWNQLCVAFIFFCRFFFCTFWFSEGRRFLLSHRTQRSKHTQNKNVEKFSAEQIDYKCSLLFSCWRLMRRRRKRRKINFKWIIDAAIHSYCDTAKFWISTTFIANNWPNEKTLVCFLMRMRLFVYKIQYVCVCLRVSDVGKCLTTAWKFSQNGIEIQTNVICLPTNWLFAVQ